LYHSTLGLRVIIIRRIRESEREREGGRERDRERKREKERDRDRAFIVVDDEGPARPARV